MRFPAGSGDAFAGFLSGLAIWNSALSAARILDVMTVQLQGTEAGRMPRHPGSDQWRNTPHDVVPRTGAL